MSLPRELTDLTILVVGNTNRGTCELATEDDDDAGATPVAGKGAV